MSISVKPYRIDVHHHIAPLAYKKELEKIGVLNAGGASITTFEAEKTLEMMDRNGIEVALTALSSPGVYFGDVAFAQRLARICNEYSATVVRDHPERFGAFATLPLPNVEAALKELEYAYDTLGVDGVVLLSSYAGVYLGDEAFDDVFAELNSRKAVVLIHPDVPPTGKDIPIAVPGFTLEFVFDTTRAVTNLVASGTLERYPDIKYILPHAGGTVPYLSWRIARGVLAANGADPQQRIKRTGEITHLLEGLYYDTALSTVPNVFKALQELVPTSQILFGSDFPFANEDVTRFSLNGIDTFESFNVEDLKKIYRNNALSLFPRLRKVNSATSFQTLS